MNSEQTYKILKSSVLGETLPKNKKITILGAGIAGLFMGYFLKQNGYDFEILEIKSRAGGVLQTYQGEYGIVENAAVSFRWGKEIMELCQNLNLEVLQAGEIANKRYFFRDGEFHRFPLTVLEVAKAAYKLLFAKTQKPTNLKEFGENHLGKAATEYFLEPAFQGIYGVQSEFLSLAAVLPDIANYLNENNYLIKHVLKEMIMPREANSIQKPLGFKNGMSELVDALAHFLKEHIQYNTTLTTEEFKQTENEIIMCIPPNVAAGYFKNTSLSVILQKINYSSLVTATVFVRKDALKKFKPGFGCLIPTEEGLQTMGIIYNNCTFPQRASYKVIESLTLIIRDDKQELINSSQNTIEELLYKELKIIYGFDGTFLDLKIIKWEKALPIYSNELHSSWFEINELLKTEYPNTRLFANYTGNIAIRGMCTQAANYVSDSNKNNL